LCRGSFCNGLLFAHGKPPISFQLDHSPKRPSTPPASFDHFV
jgi:hypothetical protein